MKKTIGIALMYLCVALSFCGFCSASNCNDSTLSDRRAASIVVFSSGMTYNDIVDSEVVCVNFSEIERVSDIAKNIVDSGKLLYIAEPQVSAEEVSEILSIPKYGITSYPHQVLAAYSIFKNGDRYIFSNHYISGLSTPEQAEYDTNSRFSMNDFEETDAPRDDSVKSNVTNFHNAILLSDYACEQKGDFDVNFEDLIDVAVSSRYNIERSIVNSKNNFSDSNYSFQTRNTDQIRNTDLPSEIATEIFNNTMSVYGLGNTYYGYLNCTVYGYAKGYGIVNGSNSKIYDVVSVVKAYPTSSYKVCKYDAQIRCNFTGFNNLQTADIQSGVDYSQDLQLSGTYETNGGSSSLSYTTGWSYNPESQIIDETSSVPRIVKWKVQTVNPSYGKAYDIAPGMRVSCPTNNMRGAFCKVFCDALILGFTVNTNELEVGGWF